MTASFGHELLGREVVDAIGDRLGVLEDFIIDVETGDVMNMLIKIGSELDPSKLPWSMSDGLLKVPIEMVDRIAMKVHLRT
ncbi:MAG: PRC-barrel domain-containing protein [Euryarchaeota archaeon]|jgi:sporulation protein YlmC with PRC-barrel domain|nr:PRC-barrel domain-containing protein [Euryarchaeota archaeon]HIK78878.1 PRC-barrel domain containing protein [Candidatus Poseidoniales archaeon]MBT3970644.1 PRC-barrel domain-containing protein [Euryarchaeota archaeon]MBT4407693.1 PRC-barrel domain-containing protein [Euryarchaeota archaeon]MBT6644604.1 PRC-barrel domain-containing protein [Euryarchaeota archaeon]